ncbi:putative asialoglycoprotein receptor 1-like [Apostichopus japonicus]|uniref:Putative asialoglycoprotein receptor 1-like n=1 Tax=Stichopus japonicus TaxID=307972 RepID=A0A2G8KTG0_STIJA|nr:putative asialoglycoprotein receptor 1-like [Apostichopus japonicus]
MVCLFEGVTSDNVCDDKWKIYHDNCYLFSELFSGTNKENWSNARTECDDRSANLTAIEDQDTWDWVVRQISSLDLSDELWIGLYKSNNVYDWDDGTHPNTSNL